MTRSEATPYYQNQEQGSVVLTDPLSMPKAAGFLWNKKMMLQMNCRGYAVAQFMQPEPTKYSAGPALEATTFMQPEHHYHAQHPGRFFYIKMRDKPIFSLPFEPVRQKPDSFEFHVKASELTWHIRFGVLQFILSVSLVPEEGAEYWTLNIENTSDEAVECDIYPYFSIGFLSWMNQSASYDRDLCAIVSNKITPYQKLDDYWKNKHLKEKTFLISEVEPDSWCANAESFEGLGGLTNPDGVAQVQLEQSDAKYELPVAVMQHTIHLAPKQSKALRYMFGAAKDRAEIDDLKRAYLSAKGASLVSSTNRQYVEEIKPAIQVETPDKDFDSFVNLWLPRQLYYHGDVNRLTTDPQTRNYLQDAMGMAYLRVSSTRIALETALAQQNEDGSMPDGVLLHPEAELKYINQIPHSDHCVWLPICLQVYLNESGDYAFLEKRVPYADGQRITTVKEHIDSAMRWLAENLDERGLSLIHQGDWCDPMNMVGYKGKGVSAWLSMATSYAWQLWGNICHTVGDADKANHWRKHVSQMNERVQGAFWRNDWYARGITDEGRLFGIDSDEEGRMFLNPQSWAMLSQAIDPSAVSALLIHVKKHLETPYGPVMLAPAFTKMVEDIGRVTQKFPGSAENGSVYNHAAVFYAFALYQQGYSDDAFDVLKRMLVNPDDALSKGQLPVFIPNYFRGAWKQYPSHAGRSSQLFNTGTTAWFYRCLVEELFGLQGVPEGLKIDPRLPCDWSYAKVSRLFRQATFDIEIKRDVSIEKTQVRVDGAVLEGNVFSSIASGQRYAVEVRLAEPFK